MAVTERKLSDRWSVGIEKNEGMHDEEGNPVTKYIMDLFDLQNFHDCGFRVWYLDSPEELRGIRDAIDEFLSELKK